MQQKTFIRKIEAVGNGENCIFVINNIIFLL